MPVSDDHRQSIWQHVLDLCCLRPHENVVVLTSEASHPLNVDAAVRAAARMAGTSCRLDIPPMRPRAPIGGDRTAFVGVTPLTGHAVGVETLKRADLVIDLMGLLHSPEQADILAAGTRILMVVEPPEILGRILPSKDDKRRVMAAAARIRKGKTMTVTSRAGTDLSMQLGQFLPLAEYGYADEPGHWDHWPSGFISTWANEGSAEGRVVIDVGDMLFPFKMYVSSPITLEIKKGFITNIEGGFEATYLRRHIEAYNDPNAYGIAHVGWGLQPKARWTALAMYDKGQSLGMDARSYYGNFLFSTGPNSEAGGSNNSPCHVDIPMSGCSVSIDGEPMTQDGTVVAAEQRVELAA